MADPGTSFVQDEACGKGKARQCDDHGTTLAPIDVVEFVNSGSTPEESWRRERLSCWLCSLGATRRVRHDLTPTWKDFALAAGVFTVLVALKFNGWFLQGFNWSVSIGIVVFSLVAAYAAGIQRRGEPAKRLHPIAAPSLVAEGFCGQCGYSLRDLPVQNDGCAVCPECGSAWAGRRVTWPWWSSPEYVERVTPKDRSLRLLANTGCPNVADHFGRLVPLLTLGEVLTLKEETSGDSKAMWGQIEHELRQIGRTARLATAVISLGVFGAAAYWFSTIQALDAFARATLIGVAVLLGGGIALVVPRSDMYISRSDIRRVLATHGRCASCGEGLENQSAENGSATCAHCGSTWSLPARDSCHK